MTTVSVTVTKAVNQITVDELKNLHVRTVTRYKDGEKILSEEYHRHVLAPGSDLNSEDDLVKKIAMASWS